MVLSTKSPQRGFALQKYLLLHSQHDALQKHLSSISSINTTIPTTATNSRNSRSPSQSSSFSSSPDSPNDSYMSSIPRLAERNRDRSGSIPSERPVRPVIKQRRSSLPAVIDENILGEIEEDESKLRGVYEQIKCTLTELLNCESVRGDRSYRAWVQTRLMRTEMELKDSRSRSCERRRCEGEEY